jgi:hypothetical protein
MGRVQPGKSGTGGFGGEQEGVVKYDDCQEIVEVKQADVWFGTYTCNMQRTMSGKVMEGTCVRVETTTDGKCFAWVANWRQELEGKGWMSVETARGG